MSDDGRATSLGRKAAHDGRRRRRPWALVLPVGLLALAAAAPSILLDLGRSRARACVARISEPRGPELPDCERLSRWLELPSRVPWTATPARMLLEELQARMAVARYVDAAVGTPNRARLADCRADVLHAAELVAAGTRLLRLSELGPSIPAPDLAELASTLGDAEGLDLHSFDFSQWYSSVQAIEAALLRGDAARARRLGEHYAGRPDHDLRLLVGALLCAGEDPHRGLDEVLGVERTRADKRTANFWRNFGSARLLVEACAARADLAAPPVPGYGGAGEWDHRDRLLVMRARLAKRRPPCPADDEWCPAFGGLGEVATSIVERLESGTPLPYRAELLGAIASHLTDIDLLVALAKPRAEELVPASRAPLTIVRMVERNSRDQPFLTAEELAAAADALVSRMRDPRAAALRATAGLLYARAAAAAAGLGDATRARAWARSATPYLFDEPATAELFESSVAYLAGDADGAREALVRAELHAPAASPVASAALLQRAEIDAARRERALALDEARRAVGLARAAGHIGLEERGRWTVAALEGLLARERGAEVERAEATGSSD